MTVLYTVTRVFTFFGAAMRTFWEVLVCRMFRIPIEDIRTFKVSELCGHADHELTETRGQAFMMCWFPLTLNFLISVCLLLGGAYRVVYVGDVTNVLSWIYLWLGFSFAANCFPSYEDMLSFKDFFYGKRNKNLFLKIILAPFFALIFVGSFLEKYSVNFLIALAFSFGFPYIFSFLFPFLSALVASAS